jgi:hypothetical protein
MGHVVPTTIIKICIFRHHVAHRAGLESGQFFFSIAALMLSLISSFDFPAKTNFVLK